MLGRPILAFMTVSMSMGYIAGAPKTGISHNGVDARFELSRPWQLRGTKYNLSFLGGNFIALACIYHFKITIE